MSSRAGRSLQAISHGHWTTKALTHRGGEETRRGGAFVSRLETDFNAFACKQVDRT